MPSPIQSYPTGGALSPTTATSWNGLRDPARALRHAVRANDEARVVALIDWLLKKVPLAFSEDNAAAKLISATVIRSLPDGTTSDGFAFGLNPATQTITAIHNHDEVPQLGVGDKIVMVNGTPLAQETPLRELIPPESVATLGVWKRAAMALQRSKLARSAIDDAFLEAAISATEPAACRIAERLLRARASLKVCDEKGLTALHWAAYRGKLSLCELLLDAGSPVDGILPVGGGRPTLAEHTPLQLAVMGGHGPVVKALLTAKADPFAPARGGRQLIHLAALGKCEDLVDLLLDPDPEGGGRQKLDALSEHGWSALFLAAADDNLPMVKALLSAGAPLGDVQRGRPLLHHAACCGSAAVVRWLGQECAAQLPLDGLDGKGRTPLLLACRGSHIGTAEALLSLGASPALDAITLLDDPSVTEEVRILLSKATREYRKKRGALLLVAAAAGDVPAMRSLHVNQGADLLHVDDRGYTALHHAVATGKEEAVLYLLSTSEGEALAFRSTRAGGASADWKPIDLATNEKVLSVLKDYTAGGVDRERVMSYARKKLAKHVGASNRMAAMRIIEQNWERAPEEEEVS